MIKRYELDRTVARMFPGTKGSWVKLADHAAEVENLRNWIRTEGENNDTCTNGILGEVCSTCRCGKAKPRKPK